MSSIAAHWIRLTKRTCCDRRFALLMSSCWWSLPTRVPHTSSESTCALLLSTSGDWSMSGQQGEDLAALLPEVGRETAPIDVIDARESRYKRALDELVVCLKERNRCCFSLKSQRLQRQLGEPRNPYKGLRAFTQDDATDFFGRETLIGELVDGVKERLRSEQIRMCSCTTAGRDRAERVRQIECSDGRTLATPPAECTSWKWGMDLSESNGARSASLGGACPHTRPSLA